MSCRTISLADLARHLVAKLAAGETAEFGAVFEIVERLHVEGDPYVKNAATVGLLEDLQNSGIHTTTEPQDFQKYLLPESERWWDKLYALWNEGKLLSED